MRVLLFALSIAVWLRADAVAQVCECARVVAPCAGYWEAAAVFVGRVQSVRRSAGDRVVTFSVLDGFRGVASSTVDVSAGRCPVSFRVGREYMVYASRSIGSGMLTTEGCTRTREVEDAAADLSYVRALKEQGSVAGRISGQILLAHRDLDGKSTRAPQPLPDITVRVEKDGSTQTTVTNLAGDYSVENRGAGSYSVTVDVPPRFYTDTDVTSVKLEDTRGCAEVNAVLHDNARIKGRVVDAASRAVAGLTIELATTNLKQSQRAITDRDGRYELSRLPAGRFVVRAGTPVSAMRVTIGTGESIALDDLRLPSTASYVALSGFVLNADGTPAEGARVYLKGAGEGARILTEPATVDFLGRFVIAGLANTDYLLFAEHTRDHRVDSSDQLTVRAVNGLRPLKLVLRRRY